MSYLISGNAPGGTAAPVLGVLGPVALDASYRMRAAIEGLTGSRNLTADNLASPTTAADVASFGLGYDGATWDRLRVRAWDSTIGNETASAAALETVGMICGPNGLGGISRLRVGSTGSLYVLPPEGEIVLADSLDYSAQALWNVASINAMYVETSLPSPLTTGRQSRVRGDSYGNALVSPGLPAPNTRNNTTSFFYVDSADANVVTTAATLWAVLVSSTEAVAATVRYFQIHDKASAISGGDTPVFVARLIGGSGAGATSWMLTPEVFGPAGLRLANGLRCGWSTTATTYTAAGTPKVECSVRYK